MALRLSKHERDRVKKGIEGVRSFDIVDFPEHIFPDIAIFILNNLKI